ncbi:hypothetical protein [Saccharolobus islandicus]|uniref:hypothetical protein n=1 Tax=Saccharolobus islandicus TaxID=43080 RepID=UPI00178C3BB2|nr:hypothetical protein [Sulfolobus islandicus]
MALEVLRDLGVQVDFLRTDKYYSKSTLDDFLDSEVYLIPKSNATIKGGKRWREMILRFMKNPWNIWRSTSSVRRQSL